MKRQSVYYLQRREAGEWETLEQARSVAVLAGRLADELSVAGEAELRIATADYDPDATSWVYSQIFFVDQARINLFGAEAPAEGDTAGNGTPDYEPVAAPMAEEAPYEVEETASEFTDDEEPLTFDDDDDDDDGEASVADIDFPDDDEDEDDENIETPSWLRDSEDDTDSDLDELRALAARVTEAEERGSPTRPTVEYGGKPRRSWLGMILSGILVLILAAVIALAGLIYLQHPLVYPHATKLAQKMGIAHMLPKAKPTTGMTAPPSKSSEVSPLTTGEVVSHLGVPVNLRGKWSPDGCKVRFIEFVAKGYRAVSDNEIGETIPVTSSMEDTYQIYLRLSPEVVEHYQKLGRNDIQPAGATTRRGFIPGDPKARILSRCK